MIGLAERKEDGLTKFRQKWAWTAWAALLACTTPALANDSTAETAAGGLVLTQTDAIEMRSEDLYISADEVRVRYVFHNRTDADVTTLVAFPMPVHDLALERDSDVAFPSDFTTNVAGAPVNMQVERRAYLGEVEYTDRLTALGIPVSPGDDGAALIDALDALPPAELQRLAALGLIALDDYDAGIGPQRFIAPLWRVEERWYWEQLFPAGEDLVVEHRYRPGTGGSVDTILAFADLRGEDYAQQMIADYCVDSDFLAGVDRMHNASEFAAVTEQRIGYILTTGGNWAAPIGQFRLVVDKGEPGNLVSFCAEGVRKISPTQFEVRHENWRPEADLNVLILHPYREE